MARDIYSRLEGADGQMLRTIANALEVRGSHPQQVAIRTAYLDRLGDLGGLRVLDVGCGTGVATRDFARRVGSRGQVVGIDPTSAFIDIAEQRRAEQHIDNVEYRVVDGRSLPFADGSFDLVAAVTVLSHLPDRDRVLREMVRTCRPGGTILIVDGEFSANQIEHPDLELTQRIVEAWRTTTVDDPRLMRRIVPWLRGFGLRAESILGHVHIETGRVEEDSSFIWQWCLFAIRQALGASAIDESEGTRWLDQFRVVNERGELFGSSTFVSVVVRRP